MIRAWMLALMLGGPAACAGTHGRSGLDGDGPGGAPGEAETARTRAPARPKAAVAPRWMAGETIQLAAPAELITFERDAPVRAAKSLPARAKREILKVRRVGAVDYLLVYDGWLDARALKLTAAPRAAEEPDARFVPPPGGW